LMWKICDGTIIFWGRKQKSFYTFNSWESFQEKYKEDASSPKGLPRPTTDMSKEALFNVLNNHFSFEGLKY
jgi:hypothetical protein